MFCEKCGREIRHDSVYCSYCGVPIENPDWEPEEGTKAGSPAGRPLTKQQAVRPADNCVRPGAPRKHCADCQKELPGSAISDICALCTIRRRNRELDDLQKREDEEYASRDRYQSANISRVAEQRESERRALAKKLDREQRREETLRAESGSVWKMPEKSPDWKNPAEKKPKKGLGVRVSMLIFGLIMVFSFIMSFADDEFDSPPPTPPQSAPGMETMVTADGRELLPGVSNVDELYDDYISQAVRAMAMADAISIWPDIEADGALAERIDTVCLNYDWEGAIIETTCIVTITTEPDDTSYEVIQRFLMNDSQYKPLYSEWDGEILYDNTDYVDTRGIYTAIGAEADDTTPSTPVFEYSTVFPDDYV